MILGTNENSAGIVKGWNPEQLCPTSGQIVGMPTLQVTSALPSAAGLPVKIKIRCKFHLLAIGGLYISIKYTVQYKHYKNSWDVAVMCLLIHLYASTI